MFTTCLIFMFAVWAAAPVQGSGTQLNITERPRDCQDLIKQGNFYEAHYVIYPEDDVPNEPTIIYCSQEEGMKPMPSHKKIAMNCQDLLEYGLTNSGPAIIYPYSYQPDEPLLVYCDQDTSNGGWTVIQRRFDGSEDFYRDWYDYSIGFGNVEHEHYLGNENIAALTGQESNELLVNLGTWDGELAYALYLTFLIGTANDNYKLITASPYYGTAGDGLHYDIGHDFTTLDVDHDTSAVNCAEDRHGGWWYGDCGYVNLNGRYYPSSDTDGSWEGMLWYQYQKTDSLKSSTLMVRPYRTERYL